MADYTVDSQALKKFSDVIIGEKGILSEIGASSWIPAALQVANNGSHPNIGQVSGFDDGTKLYKAYETARQAIIGDVAGPLTAGSFADFLQQLSILANAATAIAANYDGANGQVADNAAMVDQALYGATNPNSTPTGQG
ncbi:MAG: hypothetical protein ACRDNZ_04945 [Streptosporangiaceae bacterium]